MEPLLQKILVVGGNGFVGSAVCKAALARGMQVTSISTSGRPYTTPKGHSPAWTSKVNWQAGDALKPSTYAHLLRDKTAVVHTLGTLLEDTQYKTALKEGDVSALVKALISNVTSEGSSGNPLAAPPNSKDDVYEKLNKEAALQVCETFLQVQSDVPSAFPNPRAFVYVSAEDIFRPFISARYINTKRETEVSIRSMVRDRDDVREVFIRPSLIYHPHFRPLTSPIAALLDLSATIHSTIPRGLPSPAALLRTIASTSNSLSSSNPPSNSSSYAKVHGSLVNPSPLDSVANALTIPPIHVDHVAEAICIAMDNERSDVRGVYGVSEMRELIGWHEKGRESIGHGHLQHN